MSDQLPVHMSVPFVNCSWMSDFFSGRDATQRGEYRRLIIARLMRLDLGDTTRDCLVRLAGNIDGFEDLVATSPEYARELGLTAERPSGDGYPTVMSVQTKTFYALMSAIVLDRSLWALGAGGNTALSHWIHPHNPEPSRDLKKVDEAGMLVIDEVRKSIGSLGVMHAPGVADSDVTANVTLATRSVTHHSVSGLHGVLSNVDYMATVILSLSKVSTVAQVSPFIIGWHVN